jgi:hypothetical protein
MYDDLGLLMITSGILKFRPDRQFDIAYINDSPNLWIEVINNGVLSLAFEHGYAKKYTDLTVEEFVMQIGKRNESSFLWETIVESGIIIDPKDLLEIANLANFNLNLHKVIVRTKILTEYEQLLQLPYRPQLWQEILKLGLIQDVNILFKIGNQFDNIERSLGNWTRVQGSWIDVFPLIHNSDFEVLLQLGLEINSKLFWETFIKSHLVTDLSQLYTLVCIIVERYPEIYSDIWIYAVETGLIRDLNVLSNLSENIPVSKMQVAVVKTGVINDPEFLMEFGRAKNDQETWTAIVESAIVVDEDSILSIAMRAENSELRASLVRSKYISLKRRYHFASEWNDLVAWKSLLNEGEINDVVTLCSIGESMEDTTLWSLLIKKLESAN